MGSFLSTTQCGTAPLVALSISFDWNAITTTFLVVAAVPFVLQYLSPATPSSTRTRGHKSFLRILAQELLCHDQEEDDQSLASTSTRSFASPGLYNYCYSSTSGGDSLSSIREYEDDKSKDDGPPRLKALNGHRKQQERKRQIFQQRLEVRLQFYDIARKLVEKSKGMDSTLHKDKVKIGETLFYLGEILLLGNATTTAAAAAVSKTAAKRVSWAPEATMSKQQRQMTDPVGAHRILVMTETLQRSIVSETMEQIATAFQEQGRYIQIFSSLITQPTLAIKLAEHYYETAQNLLNTIQPKDDDDDDDDAGISPESLSQAWKVHQYYKQVVVIDKNKTTRRRVLTAGRKQQQQQHQGRKLLESMQATVERHLKRASKEALALSKTLKLQATCSRQRQQEKQERREQKLQQQQQRLLQQ